MSTMQSRIEKFIKTHELSEDMSEELTTLVKKCIGDLFEHVKDKEIPETVTKVKEPKEPKEPKEVVEKLDDPNDAKDRDDLRNCTKEVLNQYCKDKGLRVGGNKKDVMDRVWRNIQGDSSDDDISPRSKPKPTKKEKAEKHTCSCKLANGSMCQTTAEGEVNSTWYCWRHIKKSTM